jgi:hypothetical protein
MASAGGSAVNELPSGNVEHGLVASHCHASANKRVVSSDHCPIVAEFAV